MSKKTASLVLRVGVGVGVSAHTWGSQSLSQRSSYLPFVPFDPFPSTLFIVSFTLLHPGSRNKRRWEEGRCGYSRMNICVYTILSYSSLSVRKSRVSRGKIKPGVSRKYNKVCGTELRRALLLIYQKNNIMLSQLGTDTGAFFSACKISLLRQSLHLILCFMLK